MTGTRRRRTRRKKERIESSSLPTKRL
uniref:Uncharacterized protein n=1 Tax=Rhizophora mucronata TaxID=61149 RepID=A0A2P2PGT1_RHIMU